jgi:hypothetical protein
MLAGRRTRAAPEASAKPCHPSRVIAAISHRAGHAIYCVCRVVVVDVDMDGVDMYGDGIALVVSVLELV